MAQYTSRQFALSSGAKPLALAAQGFAATTVAHAGLLSYESFSGYADSTPLDAQTPTPAVTGYTGDWIANANTSYGDQEALTYSTGLNYAGQFTTGGRAGVPFNYTGGSHPPNGSGRVARALDSTLTVDSSTNTTLYLSFLFQSGLEDTEDVVYQALELYKGISVDADNDPARAFQAGFNRSTDFIFGAGNADAVESLAAADTGVHLFIVKFDLSSAAASDNVTVWLDSKTETGGITTTGLDLEWDTLSLADYDNNSASWDEIRWGTTFEDVVWIPEPSTFALLFGCVSWGWAKLRRRK